MEKKAWSTTIEAVFITDDAAVEVRTYDFSGSESEIESYLKGIVKHANEEGLAAVSLRVTRAKYFIL